MNRFKLQAFALSAALAGLAGGTKVLATQLATLVDVHWATSGEALLICIVGGLQTLLGPVVGAIVIVSMEHYLASCLRLDRASGGEVGDGVNHPRPHGKGNRVSHTFQNQQLCARDALRRAHTSGERHQRVDVAMDHECRN